MGLARFFDESVETGLDQKTLEPTIKHMLGERGTSAQLIRRSP